MIRKKAAEKTIIPLIGLISGILLFLGVFSASAEAIIFNFDYHSKSLTRLGATGLINDKIYEYLEISGYGELIGPYVENRVNEELVLANINSLVGGLLDYIKGTADTLPYIYLSQLNELTDSASTISDAPKYTVSDIHKAPEEITASPLLALSKIDRVNLRLLMMFYNEQDADGILKTASLLHFCIDKILIISLVLFSIISILIHIQKKAVFLVWFKYAAFFHSVICFTSIYFILLLKRAGQYSLEITLSSIDADFFKLASSYLAHIADSLIKHLFLSVVLILIILCLSGYRAKVSSEHKSDMYKLMKKPASWKALIVLTALFAVLYLQIGRAASEYSKRDLRQAAMLLHGNKMYRHTTDAKGNDVCFLRISVTDGLTGEPLKAFVADIYQISRDEGSFVRVASFDNDSSSLLLEKGSCRLIIDYEEAYPDLAFRAPAVYDFTLDCPGRTELNIVLDIESDAALQIKSASLQYIP